MGTTTQTADAPAVVLQWIQARSPVGYTHIILIWALYDLWLGRSSMPRPQPVQAAGRSASRSSGAQVDAEQICELRVICMHMFSAWLQLELGKGCSSSYCRNAGLHGSQ